MLLRMPRTNVIYVTSTLVDPVIIDYYLHLLPGIGSCPAATHHAQLCRYFRPVPDGKYSSVPLPVERIKTVSHQGHPAHLACFNVTRWNEPWRCNWAFLSTV